MGRRCHLRAAVYTFSRDSGRKNGVQRWGFLRREQVDAADRAAIEAAIDDLKTVIGGDDKDAIEAKSKKLAEVSGKVAQAAYQAEQAAGGAEAPAGAGARPAGDDDNVVDADFEEVKDK